MFKSCDYCRHRKKKCVLPHACAPRCADCEHLDLICEFSLRQPSLKRRRTSQRIASRLSAAAAATAATGSPRWRWPQSDRVVALVKDGDCQLARAGGTGSSGDKIILKDDVPDRPESTAEKYWRYVYPLTPFLPPEMIAESNGDWDPILQHCVELAASLWLHHNQKQHPKPAADQLLGMVAQGELSLPVIAGILLLALRMPLDDSLIQRASPPMLSHLFHAGANGQQLFHAVQTASLAGEVLPLPILAGTVLTNTWLRLVGRSPASLSLPEDCLQDCLQSLDHSTFGHHYIRISHLALSYNRLRSAAEHDGIGPESRLAWSRLEYECLLWAVQLPSTLLDLRDELPARPEAVVIHSLHNLVLLSLYTTIIDWQDTLGNLLGLRPVPGVLHYICALARSILICPREMPTHWALLLDIQAATARALLRLWHRTQFENLRGLLNLWDDAQNRFPDLARLVREEIGPGPWTIDQTDGYSVFWTFRDLRSLHLEFTVPELTAIAASSPSSSAAHRTNANANNMNGL